MKIEPPRFGANTVARVMALPKMTMAELKAQWRQLFEQDPVIDQRRYMERRIAYRLQELDWAKAHADTLRDNRNRIDALVETGALAPRIRNGKPMPGSVMIRNFGGEDHVVTVMSDGRFDYRGQCFTSLSAVAKHITGTPWSGPVFFGLRSSKSKGGTR